MPDTTMNIFITTQGMGAHRQALPSTGVIAFVKEAPAGHPRESAYFAPLTVNLIPWLTEDEAILRSLPLTLTNIDPDDLSDSKITGKQELSGGDIQFMTEPVVRPQAVIIKRHGLVGQHPLVEIHVPDESHLSIGPIKCGGSVWHPVILECIDRYSNQLGPEYVKDAEIYIRIFEQLMKRDMSVLTDMAKMSYFGEHAGRIKYFAKQVVSHMCTEPMNAWLAAHPYRSTENIKAMANNVAEVALLRLNTRFGRLMSQFRLSVRIELTDSGVNFILEGFDKPKIGS